MSDVFAVVEGEFGKVVVLELCHDLVPHSHAEIQLNYWVAGGECLSDVGGSSVRCSETQAIGINRYQAHDESLGEATISVTMLTLYLNETWFDEHFASHTGPINFKSAQLSQTCEMKSQCWALMQTILFATPNDSSSIEAHVKALLTLTIESNLDITTPLSHTVRRKMLDYRLRQALSHLRENMTQLNLMKTLSQTVGISRSRLYELFKKELQTTPKLILNSLLIDSAIKHMAQSTVDLSHVSKKLGFSTAANFSRFFRGHQGVTPTCYRKVLGASFATRSPR
jgi:AraC-like DNA-binding protein